jgi:hypothetical protein
MVRVSHIESLMLITVQKLKSELIERAVALNVLEDEICEVSLYHILHHAIVR